jgi:hypothetical protein
LIQDLTRKQLIPFFESLLYSRLERTFPLTSRGTYKEEAMQAQARKRGQKKTLNQKKMHPKMKIRYSPKHTKTLEKKASE